MGKLSPFDLSAKAHKYLAIALIIQANFRKKHFNYIFGHFVMLNMFN